jgi:8-oxo-dGTP pyrophosphatase MutT (NUDIX family)
MACPPPRRLDLAAGLRITLQRLDALSKSPHSARVSQAATWEDPSMSPPGHVPPTFHVSIKGVVVRSGKVLLLKNERDEWELPGGRIELGETPQECVAREVAEETRWKITTGPVLDTWMYYIAQATKPVFIVTYGCHLDSATEPVLSHEHKEIGLFAEHEVPTLNMPESYKRSIATWYAHLRDETPDQTG